MVATSNRSYAYCLGGDCEAKAARYSSRVRISEQTGRRAAIGPWRRGPVDRIGTLVLEVLETAQAPGHGRPVPGPDVIGVGFCPTEILLIPATSPFHSDLIKWCRRHFHSMRLLPWVPELLTPATSRRYLARQSFSARKTVRDSHLTH